MAYSAISRRLRRVDRAGFRSALLAGVLLIGAAPSDAQAQVQLVLVLQSFDRGNLVVDSFTGTFRVALDQRAGTPLNVVQVVVGPAGSVGASEQAVVDYIRATFANRPQPDLIVTIAGPAAVFARKYRRQLFPDTPLLFASVDQRYLRDAPPRYNETAVTVTNDFPELVDDILQLRPQTRQVFMVMGAGPLGKFWRRELEDQFRRFQGRLTFVWSNDLSFAEILRRCASLPNDSAIFYLTFGTDALGGAYPDDQVVRDLHQAANVPLFAKHDVMLGHGVVGGRLVSIDDLASKTADVASRMLNGVRPDGISVPSQSTRPPAFDWRELQRWGIAESRLPAGSVVHYRRPSLWQEYRLTVLGATAALVIQALLIAGLLYQRRARQRAEQDSRRSLTIAADASRRSTMSALSSSIAHELGQPLSSIIHNAEALQMMVSANRATSDTIGEILSDIRAQGVQATQIVDRQLTMLRSRQLEKKPIDLHAVINESVALVAHDMSEREIAATVQVSSNPCVISGDQVLLQQVLVNLMVNAMDAVAELPPARRHITLSTDVRAADVAIAVRDTGTGLPAHINGTLFAPFVTTKSHGIGIGLTIARTIVDAHSGTIDAHTNPEGGATFTVRLPRSVVPEILPEPPGR